MSRRLLYILGVVGTLLPCAGARTEPSKSTLTNRFWERLHETEARFGASRGNPGHAPHRSPRAHAGGVPARQVPGTSRLRAQRPSGRAASATLPEHHGVKPGSAAVDGGIPADAALFAVVKESSAWRLRNTNLVGINCSASPRGAGSPDNPDTADVVLLTNPGNLAFDVHLDGGRVVSGTGRIVINDCPLSGKQASKVCVVAIAPEIHGRAAILVPVVANSITTVTFRFKDTRSASHPAMSPTRVASVPQEY